MVFPDAIDKIIDTNTTMTNKKEKTLKGIKILQRRNVVNGLSIFFFLIIVLTPTIQKNKENSNINLKVTVEGAFDKKEVLNQIKKGLESGKKPLTAAEEIRVTSKAVSFKDKVKKITVLKIITKKPDSIINGIVISDKGEILGPERWLRKEHPKLKKFKTDWSGHRGIKVAWNTLSKNCTDGEIKETLAYCNGEIFASLDYINTIDKLNAYNWKKLKVKKEKQGEFHE